MKSTDRNLIYSKQHRALLASLLIAFAFVAFVSSCQSPYEHPPDISRRVTVRVIDSANTPLPSIPVEVFHGGAVDEKPISAAVTDRNGNAFFDLLIPQSGGVYTFLAGSTTTGKVTTTASLLCQDTTLVVILGGLTIPCGAAITDSIIFQNVCARTTSGVEFPDSIQRQYCSTCDVPLTMTFQSLDTPDRFRMKVFDHNGVPVTGNSFTLPPRACFSARIIFTPQQVASSTASVTFSGTGGNNSQMSVTLGMRGTSVQCSQCVCGDSITTIMFPGTVASPPDSSFVTRTVNPNRTTCTRDDRLTKNFTTNVFQLQNNVLPTVHTNESQPVQIRFAPPSQGTFSDTLIYETTYRESGLRCRHLVIVRGAGVQPLCCLDLASTSAGYKVSTITPRVDTLRLMVRAYESTTGSVCFYNCGTGGTLILDGQLAFPTQPGFQVTPNRLSLTVGAPSECFTVRFRADTTIVRPNGLGGPARVRFETDLNITGCTPQKVHIVAEVDTLPILFSNCVYRWSQNAMNGYNFTPPENKGSFILDVNGNNANMGTDFTLMSIGVGSADVRVRSGWRLIRTGVNDQTDFTYVNVQQYPNFSTIKQGPFTTQQDFTMNLYSVYSIRIQRGSVFYYALVRVREISTDGQKDKICFDVLFPM